jgi:hypothetical protein
MSQLKSPLLVCSFLVSGVFVVFCFAAVRFPAGGGISLYGPFDFVVDARLGEEQPVRSFCKASTVRPTPNSSKKRLRVLPPSP